MSESTARQPFGSTVVPIIIAVILTEALMYSLGSRYNPLSDDFDIANFLIDLGTLDLVLTGFTSAKRVSDNNL